MAGADARAVPPVVLEQPWTGWVGGIFVTVLLGALTLFMLAVSLLLLAQGNIVALVPLAVCCVMAGLVLYVWRDTRGKVGWRVTLAGDGLDLDLPSGRSLTHRLRPVRAHLGYGEIASVETRLEAYSGRSGLTNMQRGYALRLARGEVIYLGEDRALGSALASSPMAPAAAEIARRCGHDIRDLGMAEGRAGLFSLLFVTAPDWDAPSVSIRAARATVGRRAHDRIAGRPGADFGGGRRAHVTGFSACPTRAPSGDGDADRRCREIHQGRLRPCRLRTAAALGVVTGG